jgi:hypothetical protein
MIQFGHQLRADLSAKNCLACGEMTQWVGSYEPLPGIKIERHLCDKCVEAGKRVGGIVGQIIAGIRALRAEAAARDEQKRKGAALCARCGQAQCEGHDGG